MAFGAAAKAKNAAAQFAESNEYAAKALQMGGQVAGAAAGIAGVGGAQAGAYGQASDGTVPEQFTNAPAQFGAPGGFNQPGQDQQVMAPTGSFGEGGQPQPAATSSMPR